MSRKVYDNQQYGTIRTAQFNKNMKRSYETSNNNSANSGYKRARDNQFGGNKPEKTVSLDDLRNEFNKLTEDDPIMDIKWENMDNKVKQTIQDMANDKPTGNRGQRQRQMPVIVNGNIVTPKEQLLVNLVLNNKSSLESQLTLTKWPTVGLDFIVEYIDPIGELPRIYFCKLCKQFNSCDRVMEHITGYYHRVRYIANKFPSQARPYLLPDGKRANKNQGLVKMAQDRCRDLELVYGRGEYATKEERAVIPSDCEIDLESEFIFDETESKQTEKLRKAYKMIRACKLCIDEDLMVAKHIINELTEGIIDYKNAASATNADTTISSLLNLGRNTTY